MWGYLDHFTTSSKILYDKTTDYLTYYVDAVIHKTEQEIEEKIDENDYRLFPTLSYSNSYKGFTSDPTLIIDNIYLGSAYNAASFETLKKFDIKIVMNATTEIRNYFPEYFVYYKYNLYDNNKQSITKYLDDSFNTIRFHQDNTSGNILIIVL
jgi:hypothetical protein